MTNLPDRIPAVLAFVCSPCELLFSRESARFLHLQMCRYQQYGKRADRIPYDIDGLIIDIWVQADMYQPNRGLVQRRYVR